MFDPFAQNPFRVAAYGKIGAILAIVMLCGSANAAQYVDCKDPSNMQPLVKACMDLWLSHRDSPEGQWCRGVIAKYDDDEKACSKQFVTGKDIEEKEIVDKAMARPKSGNIKLQS